MPCSTAAAAVGDLLGQPREAASRMHAERVEHVT